MDNDLNSLFGNWSPDDDDPEPIPDKDGILEPENRTRRAISVRECKVVNLYEVCDPDTSEPVHDKATFVLLRDATNQEVRIFISRDAAESMLLALRERQADRPVAHDLLKTLIEKLGAEVMMVTVDDLWQDTYYARITLNQHGITMDVDARPSDAIALALRCNAPIYVAEAILEPAEE